MKASVLGSLLFYACRSLRFKAPLGVSHLAGAVTAGCVNAAVLATPRVSVRSRRRHPSRITQQFAWASWALLILFCSPGGLLPRAISHNLGP